MNTSGSGPGCGFCTIAKGPQDKVEIVCKGPEWLAFFPLHPATPGHTLVIPRSHVANLWEADPLLGAELMKAVIHVGRAINTSLRPDGMNLITSAGKTADQTVFHLHLHVVPRWERDGFGRIWPTDTRYEDADLVDAASRIRTACEQQAGV